MQQLLRSGWVGRHSRDAGIEAAEKAADEVQPRIEEQQGPLAHHARLLQTGRNRPCTTIELAVAEFSRTGALVSEKPEGDAFGMKACAVLQQLYECRSVRHQGQ
nr:hypothetical protein [Synechococcus sp. RSCCF101]